MKILKHEENIIGQWKFINKKVEEDDVCRRIEWLIQHELKYISSDQSGWERLFIDPNDNRLWELTYLTSEIHGGGPPSLIHISYEKAKEKYPTLNAK